MIDCSLSGFVVIGHEARRVVDGAILDRFETEDWGVGSAVGFPSGIFFSSLVLRCRPQGKNTINYGVVSDIQPPAKGSWHGPDSQR